MKQRHIGILFAAVYYVLALTMTGIAFNWKVRIGA